MLDITTVPQTERLCATDNGDFYPCQDLNLVTKPAVNVEKHPSLFSTDVHFELLNEYTEQMVGDMQNDMRKMNITGPIIVTSFIDMDAPQQENNQLGDRLAEAFINDLQQIGLPISDYSLVGMVGTGRHRGVMHPRDLNDIRDKLDINYVLSGTLLRNERGVVVSARIINYKTRQVIASNSKLLPNVVIENLM